MGSEENRKGGAGEASGGGLAFVLGAAIGVSLGVATDQLALWIAMGAAVGLVIDLRRRTRGG